MINSRNVDELEHSFKKQVLKWLDDCKQHGIELLIISTYRDNAYQNWLYEQGRTRAGSKVTNARGGQSPHNHRVALDFAVAIGKTIYWSHAHYALAGELAEMHGIVWGGRFKLKDYGHIEKKGFKNGVL